MKCTILRNIGSAMVGELNLAKAYSEGAVVDLPKHEVESLAKHGLCVPEPVVDAPAKKTETVKESK